MNQIEVETVFFIIPDCHFAIITSDCQIIPDGAEIHGQTLPGQCKMQCNVASWAFQILTVLSHDPDAIHLPSGEIETAVNMI
jgi:hypothetical protein